MFLSKNISIKRELKGYDLPFIYKRSPFPIELGRPPYPQLSRYGTIKGRVVLDYEEVWLKMMATELRSHSLAGILDYLKLPYEKVSISNWKQTLRTDPYLILDRNLRDLELCYLIEQQVGLIELMNAIRRYVGCQWKSVLSKSRIAKILLYRKFPEKKEGGLGLGGKRKHIVRHIRKSFFRPFITLFNKFICNFLLFVFI